MRVANAARLPRKAPARGRRGAVCGTVNRGTPVRVACGTKSKEPEALAEGACGKVCVRSAAGVCAWWYGKGRRGSETVRAVRAWQRVCVRGVRQAGVV